jgi:uncharacterized membrane protein
MLQLILAVAAFVGTHLLLSHPLRGPIVGRIGEGPFLGLYSLVAAATLAWVYFAWTAVPPQTPLWPVGDVLWAIGTAIMLVASILLMGSLIGNPAAPNPSPGAKDAAVPLARSVFAVTRHPMMWSFALWAGVHVLVYPIPAQVVLAVGIAILALAGAALQDAKKERLQPARWREWEARTRYWPFAAIAAGRARLGGFRPHDWAGGLVIWLAATWAHIPLAGWAAGIWRWVP